MTDSRAGKLGSEMGKATDESGGRQQEGRTLIGGFELVKFLLILYSVQYDGLVWVHWENEVGGDF